MDSGEFVSCIMLVQDRLHSFVCFGVEDEVVCFLKVEGTAGAHMQRETAPVFVTVDGGKPCGRTEGQHTTLYGDSR
jgi:hypothetical protein